MRLRPVRIEPCTTVVPSAGVLPDVLPTDRLTETGTPVPEIRAELRRIASYRNVGSVVLTWAQAIGTVWLAVWIGNPFGYAAAFVLMGPVHATVREPRSRGGSSAAVHEQASQRFRRALGDRVPVVLSVRHLSARPLRAPQGRVRTKRARPQSLQRLPDHPRVVLAEDASRRLRVERVEEPQERCFADCASRLRDRPSCESSDAAPADRRGHRRREVVAMATAVAGSVDDGVACDQPAARHRGARRHGPVEGPAITTHHVRQSWLARFFMVPFNIGWHLGHHVDIAVPWRNLPALQRELEASGWVTEAITWPSYPALWRALRARPARRVSGSRTMPTRVLVVEDDDVIRQLITVNLELEGFEVVTAMDGQEALDRVGELAPDVVTLDVMMPRLDGWATATRLRANPDTAHIKSGAAVGSRAGRGHPARRADRRRRLPHQAVRSGRVGRRHPEPGGRAGVILRRGHLRSAQIVSIRNR